MNDDLASRVQRIAGRQKSVRAEQSRANREHFPEFAAFVDAFQARFGRCTVRYLHDEATGYTVGKPWPRGVPFSVIPPRLRKQ